MNNKKSSLISEKIQNNIKTTKEFIKTQLLYNLRKENKIVLSVLLGFLFTVLFMFSTNSYAQTTQKSVAEKIIRFHVLANSDEEFDQKLKLEVRDAVLEEFSHLFDTSVSYEETIELLESKIPEIKEFTENFILSKGYNYGANVEVTNSIFPTKQYSNVTLPAGEYTALRILIGSGEGQNWWCVLFPPLCFTDATKLTVTDDLEKELKNILTEEEFTLITNEDDEIPVKVKFKIVEWWQGMGKEKKTK